MADPFARAALGARSSWLQMARPAQLPPEDDFSWSYYLILSGRGWGKDLDVATRLPTPSGWTTMGSVRVGDCLIDERGKPCRVTGKFYPRETMAYRVEFSDGTHLVAGAGHQWVTLTSAERKRFFRRRLDQAYFPDDWARLGAVRTTEDIGATITYGGRGDLNHCIPVAQPLDLPARELPVAPWALGYWLANGHCKGPYLTAGSYKGDFDDGHVTWKLLSDGYGFDFCTRRERGCSTIRVSQFPTPSGKDIPPEYLRASIEQRKELLQGLVDGDGYGDPQASVVEFCSIHKRLAEQVLELVRSLGERPALYEGDATLGGVFISRKYRVSWRPSLFNPFGIERKRRSIRAPGAQGIRLRHRMITAVKRMTVAPVMACVTVDSPSSLYLAGEGMIPTHNTATSAQDCAWYAMTRPGESIAVVCPTDSDVRGVYFEGLSGLLRWLPPEAIAKKIKSPFYQITMVNGTVIRGFSAEKPDRLRGPQYHRAYCDELAAWKTPKVGTKEAQVNSHAWDQLIFGLRLGRKPRVVITTTPRPTPLVRKLVANPRTLIVRGVTFDNAANLSGEALDELRKMFEGTRLGRQELYGEILDDVPGALWTRGMIDAARASTEVPDLERIVVAVDPSGVRNESDTGSDEVGIVIAAKGVDGRGYVLGDWSCRLSPLGWGRRAVQAFEHFKADRIYGERNFGGAMVEHVVKSVSEAVPFREVVASRGKIVRAEPVAALYEQGRISHVAAELIRRDGGKVEVDPLAKLEDQMCFMASTGYLGDGSPDRADALVWALTELFLGQNFEGFLGHYKAESAGLDERRKQERA